MAALLVGMSVMAVLLGALMPQWSTLARREKEQELIFRGNQYARAIGLFQRKFANTAPPSIDVLVEQRFLRKKYKDPITNSEFQPIYANQAVQGVAASTGAARPGEQATANLGTPARQTLQSGFGSTGAPGAPGATGAGGIIGVTSKSTDDSLRIYNGRSKYNEWAFVYVQTAQRLQGPGQNVQPGAVGPGGPGQQRPGAFGMPNGSFPGQRPGGPGGPGGQGGQGGPGGRGGQQGPFGSGTAQPGRPPVPQPGQRPFGP